MDYIEDIDYTQPEFGNWCDDTAVNGRPRSACVSLTSSHETGLVILDVGGGHGLLDHRTRMATTGCGFPRSKVIAVDPGTQP